MLGLILVIVGLAAIAAVITVLIDHGHRRKLLAWATARRWAVREGGGEDWMECLPPGRRRTGVKVQLVGPVGGRLVTVADQWYQTLPSTGRTTSSRRTHHLTAVVVCLAAEFPPVTLQPRTLGGLGLELAQTLDARLPAWQLRGHGLIIAWPGALRVADLDHKLNQAVTLADALDPVS